LDKKVIVFLSCWTVEPTLQYASYSNPPLYSNPDPLASYLRRHPPFAVTQEQRGGRGRKRREEEGD